MDNSDNHIRLIVELISSIALIVLIFGSAFIAALMVGWPMALGFGIVFALGVIGIRRSN